MNSFSPSRREIFPQYICCAAGKPENPIWRCISSVLRRRFDGAKGVCENSDAIGALDDGDDEVKSSMTLLARLRESQARVRVLDCDGRVNVGLVASSLRSKTVVKRQMR